MKSRLLTHADRALAAKFWARADRTGGESACWLWKAGTNRTYGIFAISYARQLAHRFAWILANDRDVPEGACVCHSCDNPLCVNPAHLWLGTARENVHDAIAKGRNSPPPHYVGRGHHYGKRDRCPRGHEYSPGNTQMRSDMPTARRCLQCQKDRTARRRIARQAARATAVA